MPISIEGRLGNIYMEDALSELMVYPQVIVFFIKLSLTTIRKWFH